MDTADSMNPTPLLLLVARWRSGFARLAVRGLSSAVLAILFVLPAWAAQGIGVRNVAIEQVDDGWQLDAQFDLQLSPRIEEAVNRGVPLYFVIDFEISRPRWYWFDEKPIQQSQIYKISYTP